MSVDSGITVAVDLLSDSFEEEGGRVIAVSKERRLSVLTIPGANLAIYDFVEIDVAAELLDGAGFATETIRVANIAPFITLKALAYDDRMEQKDAYDIIYCLMYYGSGPKDAAVAFAEAVRQSSGEPLLLSAIEILQSRFCSDRLVPGYRKDGPKSYANFLTDPGQSNRDALNQRNAASVVEEFIKCFTELHQEETT